MSTARRLHYSYEEYLHTLSMSEVKLEYCEGAIYAMAGGTPAHALLGAAVIGTLHRVLPKGCRVASSDMKVRIEATDLSTFPDASVACGEPLTSKIDAHALINPAYLVEVTSTSTEDYDRGDKLGHYKQIPSLRAVLIVSHRRRSIMIIERTTGEDGGWSEREARSGEAVVLGGFSFLVDEIYDGISLESGAAVQE